MGRVGLPPLVGLLGGEPVPRRAGSLLRLGGDEAPTGQDPPDRGHRRNRRLGCCRGARGAPDQVGADGVRAGVQSLPGQLLAHRDDLILHLRCGRGGAAVRTSRPRLKRRLALDPVARDELMHPIPGHVVVASNLALAAPLHHDSGDDQPGLGHSRHLQQVSTMSRDSCQLCPETRHCQPDHVISRDTVADALPGKGPLSWFRSVRAGRGLVRRGRPGRRQGRSS